MIPTRLEDCTLDALRSLLAAGAREDDRFDLKESLPPPPDSTGKHRLRECAAAFANTKGGFIVFGVEDNALLAPSERIVGVDQGNDFPHRLATLLEGIEPRVAHRVSQPGLRVEDDRFVYVVSIEASDELHGVPSAGSWSFPRRIHGGTVQLRLSEITAKLRNRPSAAVPAGLDRRSVQSFDAELLRLGEFGKQLNISSYHRSGPLVLPEQYSQTTGVMAIERAPAMLDELPADHVLRAALSELREAARAWDTHADDLRRITRERHGVSAHDLGQQDQHARRYGVRMENAAFHARTHLRALVPGDGSEPR